RASSTSSRPQEAELRSPRSKQRTWLSSATTRNDGERKNGSEVASRHVSEPGRISWTRLTRAGWNELPASSRRGPHNESKLRYVRWRPQAARGPPQAATN